MESWDEVRTAYFVAREGTVSGAADALGVHHATVIRHIDALEGRLGVKLFQRHARGYTATEAGTDLLKVAQTTDDQFAQLQGRIKGQGQGISGDLVITSLSAISQQLTPLIATYQKENPDITVRLLTGERVFRLEYGEAHVAVRAGSKPEDLDNVVQHYRDVSVSLVASRTYIERYGTPSNIGDLKQHRFVGRDGETLRVPFMRWMKDNVGLDRIHFRTTDDRVMQDAIFEGAGLGFVMDPILKKNPDLVEIMPSLKEWSIPLWLVTHVDLHRTAKVQSFLKFLKDDVKAGA